MVVKLTKVIPHAFKHLTSELLYPQQFVFKQFKLEKKQFLEF